LYKEDKKNIISKKDANNIIKGNNNIVIDLIVTYKNGCNPVIFKNVAKISRSNGVLSISKFDSKLHDFDISVIPLDCLEGFTASFRFLRRGEK
ncbi:MAG: hypothetical protein MJ231_04390, partial [bacterium]|nr:hypothetical protein [bacterium]